MEKIYNIRHLLAKYGRKIARQHLVMGAMGNISVRDREEVWIKRGGAWLERAKPQDFIKIKLKKGHSERYRSVSKEINLHLGCYRARSDINAVIHTHPVIITAIGTVLAKFGRKRHNFGSKVAIIKYYQPGSKELAKAVKKAIKKVDCVVMVNHGIVTVGKSLKEAYHKTLDIESKSEKLLLKLFSHTH